METKLSYNFTLENITFPGEDGGGEYLIHIAAVLSFIPLF